MLMDYNVGDIITSTGDFKDFPLVDFDVIKKFKSNLPGPADLPGALLICRSVEGQILRISEQVVNGMTMNRVEIKVDRSDIINMFPSILSCLQNDLDIEKNPLADVPKALQDWVSDKYSIINYNSAEGFVFNASQQEQPTKTSQLIPVTSFFRANKDRTRSINCEYVNAEWSFYVGVIVLGQFIKMN